MTPKLKPIEENIVKEDGGAKTPLTLLQVLKDAFESYYGEERVDIVTDNNEIRVYIHFPQITITNSLNQSHIIKDLYAELKFIKNNGSLLSLAYSRTTLSTIELYSNYCHSHISLNGSQFIRIVNQKIHIVGNLTFENVCTGEGPIRTTINLLRERRDWEGNPITWASSIYKVLLNTLVVELDRAVRWESIEGGPFRKIKTLTELPRRSISNYYANFNTLAGILEIVEDNVSRYYQLINLAKLILKRAHDAGIYSLTLNPLVDKKYIITPNYNMKALQLIAFKTISELDITSLTMALLGDSSNTFTPLHRLIGEPLVDPEIVNFNLTGPVTHPSSFSFKGKLVNYVVYPVDLIKNRDVDDINETVFENLVVHPGFMKYLLRVSEQLYSFMNK